MIFVNLTTTDLERSKAFYTALGCDINPMFTDENAACVVWDENTNFMVLTHGHFSQFTDKRIADPHAVAQVLVSFSRDSREHVDKTVDAGVAAGGREPRAAQDHGFMYGRSLEDPDGNILEFLYMEPQAAAQGPEAYVAEHGAGPDPVPGR
ncbi:VOC family protein [Streptomyces fragilis]|uniref:VOC family protein n=1 Tax=Streptomyces fragilis TaxID=67301 RepID=A0ABV2YEQ4_9ACTN|nr:VOC family protein [Streptomyces fragilis]